MQTGHVDGGATAILIRLDGHEAYSRRIPCRRRMLLVIRCGGGSRRRWYRRYRRTDRRQEGYPLPIASATGSHAAIFRRRHYPDTANPTNLRQRTVHVDSKPLVHLKRKHHGQKFTLHASFLPPSLFLACSPLSSSFHSFFARGSIYLPHLSNLLVGETISGKSMTRFKKTRGTDIPRDRCSVPYVLSTAIICSNFFPSFHFYRWFCVTMLAHSHVVVHSGDSRRQFCTIELRDLDRTMILKKLLYE